MEKKGRITPLTPETLHYMQHFFEIKWHEKTHVAKKLGEGYFLYCEKESCSKLLHENNMLFNGERKVR